MNSNIRSRIVNAPKHFRAHRKEIALYALGALLWSTTCLLLLCGGIFDVFSHEDSGPRFLFPLSFLASSFFLGICFRGWIRNFHGSNAVIGAGIIAFINAW